MNWTDFWWGVASGAAACIFCGWFVRGVRAAYRKTMADHRRAENLRRIVAGEDREL